MWRILVAAFVVCSSCGPSNSGDDDDDVGRVDASVGDADAATGSTGVEPYTSGDRIKARVLSTPDGAKALNGWHDTLLDVDCYFGKAGGDSYRCLPVLVATVAAYSDDTCTVDIALAHIANICSQGDPKYAYRYDPLSTCTSVYEIFEIVAPIAPTTVYQRNSQGDCIEGTVSADYTYFSIGNMVPLTTFQSAAESIE